MGSVQPAPGKKIERLPEALRLQSVFSFWVKGEIVSDGSGKYPDIIQFRNRRFQVQLVTDWTSWGAGWVEGLAIIEVPS